MDWHAVKILNAVLARHDGIEDVATTFEHAALGLYAVALVAVFLYAAGSERLALRRGVVAGVLSAAAALAVVQVLGRIVARPRPFAAHPHQVHNFLRHIADSGFPSDHATAVSAISVALLLRSRRLGVLLLLVGVLVMVGRVALGVHYPSDVAAGALLGATAAGLTVLGPVARLVDRVTAMVGSVADRLDPRARPRLART